jgi:hypothetical protein
MFAGRDKVHYFLFLEEGHCLFNDARHEEEIFISSLGPVGL